MSITTTSYILVNNAKKVAAQGGTDNLALEKTMRISHKLLAAIILCLVCLLWGTRICPAGEQDVAVVLSRNFQPFRVALDGIKAALDDRPQVYNLATMGRAKVATEIYRTRPEIILTIGSIALSWAYNNFPRTPIVFTMVSNPSRIIGRRTVRSNVTGIRMDTPWAIIFERLKEVSPKIKRVGIILNPERAEESPDKIMELAAGFGFELLLKKAGDVALASSEFKNIENRIEALVMAPDPKLYTPKFYEYVLLSSYRNKFVLVGLSEKYTKEGALFSVRGDNRDWGVQAGRLAGRILSGVPISLIPHQFAQKYFFSFNLKTAQIIALEIPESANNADLLVK